jgi:hypothetical protein
MTSNYPLPNTRRNLTNEARANEQEKCFSIRVLKPIDKHQNKDLGMKGLKTPTTSFRR